MEPYTTGTGQKMRVHGKDECSALGHDPDTGGCCIHLPSEHCMVGFPTHWRDDRRIMERICPHGVGHPDPDDLEFRNACGAKDDGTHGCDGCCREIP